ncbi:MAG: TRAP transporter small permease [Deltaproteobacteria bacterium]|nr:TRAP transporter small permease [Deltaproteobacteria bacterium]
MTNKIVTGINQLSHAGGVAASVLILAISLLILLEIILRTVFAATTLIADEYAAYFLACLVFLGLAYTLKTEGHIRIRLLLSRLSPKGQAYLNLICSAVALIFLIYLSWHIRELFYASVISDSRSLHPSRTPIYIPQFFLLVGSFLMTLQLGANILTSIISLRSSKEQNE